MLKRAIESVLAQTFQDFEIVVVDDGLKERAKQIVDELGDRRVRYIAHSENKGCSAAKNTGINNARGRYVAILDDDDMFLPEKLKRQVAALEAAPADVGFSFTAGWERFDDRETRTNVPEGVGDYFDFALRKFSGLIDSSMMYKREVFQKVGGLDESYPTHTGAEIAIRVSSVFRGVGINIPLIWRDVRSSFEHMASSTHKRIKGREMILAQYAAEFAKRPRYLAKHLKRLSDFYRDIGDYGKAREVLRRALHTDLRLRYLLAYFGLLCGGLGYRLKRKLYA